MTEPLSASPTVQKYVLVFDFCSSTTIIEDLIRSENQERWQSLLTEIHQHLEAEQLGLKAFEIYKFVGDGWILLFDPDFPPRELFSFAQRLCNKYDELLQKLVKPALSGYIQNVGITFGLDKGSLIRFELVAAEYVGRFINVAARLQAEVKAEDDFPGGKLLMPRHIFAEMMKDAGMKEYKPRPVVLNLRNVSGGRNYRGVLLTLMDVPSSEPKRIQRWNDPPSKLDKTHILLPTEPLLDCSFEIEFSIDSDSGNKRNWFGVRLRGRGHKKDIFDGCLIYLRSNGQLDVRTIDGQSVVEDEIPLSIEAGELVRMRISLIDENIAVWINDKSMIDQTVPLLRAGRVYLHAWNTSVTIRSACLFEENPLLDA